LADTALRIRASASHSDRLIAQRNKSELPFAASKPRMGSLGRFSEAPTVEAHQPAKRGSTMISRNRIRSLPSLNALRTFEAAARHMSFSLAAQELSVTQSAISRQIKALEEFLGVELFHREPRSLILTEVGRNYSTLLHQTFQHLYDATEELLDQRQPTVLNINSLPTFAMTWLAPRLARFNAAYPRIEVRMVTSIKPIDFRKETVDVAIRIAPARLNKGEKSPIDLVMINDWTNVRSTPLTTEKLVVVCSPALLKQGPPINTPADLRNHVLLHTRKTMWHHWFECIGLKDFHIDASQTLRHFFLTIQSAVEGKGVALVPKLLVENEIQSGILVTLFDKNEVVGGCYHLLSLENNWDSGKVKALRDWLLTEVNTELR
jgi:LysR family transcriptional regulator, glycine cleavage system transcriptional activator